MTPTTISDVDHRLRKIEETVTQILDIVSEKKSFLEIKWLTKPQVMQILNVTKRNLDDIRRRNVIRSSSATGRNFKFYKADVEDYLYTNSGVGKRRKNTSKKDDDGNTN